MTVPTGTTLGTVLGVWAHPDDEAYLMAGTALHAAREGSHVACLTLTAGEAGETADPQRWPQHDLAAIRTAEVKVSMAVLGIDDHTLLDLPDGGLADLECAYAVGLIAEVVERVRPDTILTFGPDGVTGHPDHVATGHWATRAAASVLGEDCRVLAVTKTPDWLDRFAAINEGIVSSPPPMTPPDRIALHLRLGADDIERKVRSLKAQASQTTGLIDALGEDVYRDWLTEEFWVERTHP